MFGRSVRATSEETRRPLPGDELIARPIGSLTHAATIRRPCSDVWPWLAQMGAGSRAGWYSYDSLDNGGRLSSVRIVPELQQLSTGMIFPALPGTTDGFVLLAFEPDRLVILGWPSPNGTLLVTWAFVLHEMNERVTRLIVRVRAGRGYQFHRLPSWLGQPIVRLVHFIMQRKQLLGVAWRAESTPAATAPAQHTRSAA
jgi:hypothetical protein